MIPMKTRITEQRRSRNRPEYMEETESPPTLSFSDGDDRDNHSLSSLSDNSSSDGKESTRDYISHVKEQNQNTYSKSSLSHSLSAEAHCELDQLMDILNTGIEESASQVMKHNSILHGNSNGIDVLSSSDVPSDKSVSIVTRRVLKLRQRERSLSKSNHQSSPKEVNGGDDGTIAARTVSSQGHKSILTSATGYTEGTGTTAPHANTIAARFTRKFKRKKDSHKIGSKTATIPECITMSCSGETDASASENQQVSCSTSTLMVTQKALVSEIDDNMVSPKEIALARKAPSERRFKNDLDNTTKLNIIARRLVQAQSHAEHKYNGESTALGMVQSLFECCSLQHIVEEEASSGALEYKDYF